MKVFKGKKAKRNNDIFKDYFKTDLTLLAIAGKYNLSQETIRKIIKTGLDIKAGRFRENVIQILFKGRRYKSPKTLAQKLGIKPESVVKAIKRGTKYEGRFKINYYKKII